MNKNYICTQNGYTLRFACKEDMENYYLHNYCPLDKVVSRFTGCKEEFSQEEVITFFMQSLADKNRCFFLIIDSLGKIVGESVINQMDLKVRSANFRIAIFDKNARNQGIGTWVVEKTIEYAFEQLHLHRLELDVYSFNQRALKVYLKAGFRKEGILRDAIMDQGKYADDILMSILEDEYRQIKRQPSLSRTI